MQILCVTAGTSGQIVVVTLQSQLISSPELILSLDNGTDVHLGLSKCNNSVLLSSRLTFPAATFIYKFIGYDETGAFIEYTVEESVGLGSSESCHEYAYAACLDNEEDPICVCRAGYTGNDSYCTGIYVYLHLLKFVQCL